MSKAKTTGEMPLRVGLYFWILALIWTLLVCLSLLWSLDQKRRAAQEAARIQASTVFEKDVLYRRWNARHGGVYAPVADHTKPNPYLKVPERDITTPQGRLLTKINPAFMTRQVHELGALESGVLGHITSLKPLRPQNRPDSWEARALELLEQGRKEVFEVVILKGAEYLRLMRPLTTEQSCLACHADQGYKLNDIRGGISVSVPLEPLQAGLAQERLLLVLVHIVLWLTGVALLTQIFNHFNTKIEARRQAEKDRIEQEKLAAAVKTAAGASHKLNQPLQGIVGQADLLLMELPEGSPLRERVEKISGEVERLGGITARLNKITSFQTADYAGDDEILDLDGSAPEKKKG